MIFRFRISSYKSLQVFFLIGFSIFIGTIDSYAQSQDSLWMMGWHSEWDDALHDFEVTFETPYEDDYGEIEATWAHLQDWSQWDYTVGDHSGSIWQKWPDRDDEWELRSDGNTTTIRNRWRNDNSEVIINFNDEIKVIWIAKSFNSGNNWQLFKSEYGEFEFYTEYIDDPRDWIIYDNTSMDLPFDIKMACCFIAMYRSTKQFRN